MKRILLLLLILGLVFWTVPALAQPETQGSDQSSNTIYTEDWAVGVTEPQVIVQGAAEADLGVTLLEDLNPNGSNGPPPPVKQQAATGEATVEDNSGQDLSNKGLWENDDNIVQTQLPVAIKVEKKKIIHNGWEEPEEPAPATTLLGSNSVSSGSSGKSGGFTLYNQMAADDEGTIGVDLRNAEQKDGNNVAGDNTAPLTSWKNDDGVQVGNDVGNRNLMGEMEFKDETAINTGSMDRSVMVGDKFDEEAAINTGTFTGLQAGGDVDDETAVNTGEIGERAINAGKVEVKKGGWLITGTAGMENSFNKVKSGKAPVAYSTGDNSPAMAVEDAENPNFQSNAGDGNININHVDNSAAVREIEKETKIEFKVKDFGAETVSIGLNGSDGRDNNEYESNKGGSSAALYMNKSALEIHNDKSTHNIAEVENEAELDTGVVFNNNIQTVTVSELSQVNSGIVGGDFIMNTASMTVDSSTTSIEGAVALSYSQGGVANNTASANVINVTANTNQTNSVQIPITTDASLDKTTTIGITESFNNNGPFVPVNTGGTVIKGDQINNPPTASASP